VGRRALAEYGNAWGRIGWLAAFFYAVCAALRLARFNARAAGGRQALFRGPAEPVGGCGGGGLRLVLERMARAGPRRSDPDVLDHRVSRAR
jgi:CDP-diacylglycerol---serine O-phosphatidyltransferase